MAEAQLGVSNPQGGTKPPRRFRSSDAVLGLLGPLGVYLFDLCRRRIYMHKVTKRYTKSARAIRGGGEPNPPNARKPQNGT